MEEAEGTIDRQIRLKEKYGRNFELSFSGKTANMGRAIVLMVLLFMLCIAFDTTCDGKYRFCFNFYRLIILFLVSSRHYFHNNKKASVITTNVTCEFS